MLCSSAVVVANGNLLYSFLARSLLELAVKSSHSEIKLDTISTALLRDAAKSVSRRRSSPRRSLEPRPLCLPTARRWKGVHR